VGGGSETLAQNADGEVWRPKPASANGLAAAATTCEFLASNTPPDQLAAAFRGAPMLYELRRDGTVWEKPVSLTTWGMAWTAPAGATWRRFGKRADWTGIWGDGSTGAGLTSDGVLWIWGVNPSGAPSRDFFVRLELLEERLRHMLGLAPTARSARAAMGIPDYENHPYPVLRMVRGK